MRVPMWCVSLSLLWISSGCATSPAPSATVAPAAAACPDDKLAGELAAVAFLAGTWADRGAEVETEEHWTGPRGDAMLGVNRTVKGGRMVHHEFLMIERTAEGVFYRAWPVGQPPASFRLVDSAQGRVTFENDQHDFPQRITYELTDPSTVRATIEGVQDGKPRRESWSWRRVAACR